MKKKIKAFVGKEGILCVAALLALFSMFLTPPDRQYAGYVDVRVLALLFSLMVVTAGLQSQGVFEEIAHVILKKAGNYRQLCMLLVFLCFFSSMFITNDVALITFVPFAAMLLKMAGLREKLAPLVALQTVAANLGSMLTPVGNPQNLYVYAVSGMGIWQFLRVTAPLTAVSFALLFFFCAVQKKTPVDSRDAVCPKRSGAPPADAAVLKSAVPFAFFLALFALSILSVLRMLPFWAPLTVAVIGTLFVKREVLGRVDYGLLLTFLCFFVFIGNVGRLEPVREALEGLLAGRELWVGFAVSQVISNVPAAVLLSGFTREFGALLQGVNIGGLGTLIASLASLISYKIFAAEQPRGKGKYLLVFTGINAVFAAVLLGAAVLWR